MSKEKSDIFGNSDDFQDQEKQVKDKLKKFLDENGLFSSIDPVIKAFLEKVEPTEPKVCDSIADVIGCMEENGTDQSLQEKISSPADHLVGETKEASKENDEYKTPPFYKEEVAERLDEIKKEVKEEKEEAIRKDPSLKMVKRNHGTRFGRDIVNSEGQSRICKVLGKNNSQNLSDYRLEKLQKRRLRTSDWIMRWFELKSKLRQVQYFSSRQDQEALESIEKTGSESPLASLIQDACFQGAGPSVSRVTNQDIYHHIIKHVVDILTGDKLVDDGIRRQIDRSKIDYTSKSAPEVRRTDHGPEENKQSDEMIDSLSDEDRCVRNSGCL